VLEAQGKKDEAQALRTKREEIRRTLKEKEGGKPK
jgi:hypothetical protein